MENSRLHRQIESLLAAHNVPGVSLALVRDGQRFFSGAYGLHDRERATPMTRRSVFRAGSLTKLLTAIVALRLAERGSLSLDEPVIKQVPELTLRDRPSPSAITLRHLLSHASGVPRGPYSRDALSPEVRLQQLASMSLAYPTETVRKYSNLGFAIAGHALSRAAEDPYRELAQSHVLAPLGLERSGVTVAGESVAGLATGYQRDHYRSLVRRADALRPAPALSVDQAAGGLWTTAEDLGDLLAALLRSDGAVLRPDSWAELLAPQPPAKPQKPYGLGLYIGRRFGRRYLWHSGGTAGYCGLLIAFPDDGVGGVALCNRCSAWHALDEILKLLLAPELGVRYPRRDPAAGWRRYIGSYSSPDGSFDVLQSGSRLELRTDGETFALRAHGRHRFVQEGGPWSDHLLRFIVERSRAVACVAGPWRFIRSGPLASLLWHEVGEDGRPMPAPVPEYRGYSGTYRHPAVGDVMVFVRSGKLLFSFYYGEEVVLEHVGGSTFRARGGVFTGEPVVFHPEGEVATAIDAGYMRFERRAPRGEQT